MEHEDGQREAAGPFAERRDHVGDPEPPEVGDAERRRQVARASPKPPSPPSLHGADRKPRRRCAQDRPRPPFPVHWGFLRRFRPPCPTRALGQPPGSGVGWVARVARAEERRVGSGWADKYKSAWGR